MKSTRSNAAVKRPTLGSKEYPRAAEKVGLYPHSTGTWCKTLGRKTIYCGSWLKGVPWEEALRRYQVQVDALKEGRDPKAGLAAHIRGDNPRALPRPGQPANSDVALGEAGRDWLGWHRDRVAAGKLSPDTIRDMVELVAILEKKWGGKTRRFATIGPDDFVALLKYFESRWGNVRVNKFIALTRRFCRYVEAQFTKCPAEYGDKFRRVPAKVLRREKRVKKEKHGEPIFEPLEFQIVLHAASPEVKAMTLLGLNCGFENEALALLNFAQLKQIMSGFHHIPRAKTECDRKAKVWPETIAALKGCLAVRPKPSKTEYAEYVFLTWRGNPWTAVDKKALAYRERPYCRNPLTQQFTKVLERLGIKRPGLSFYSLRHTLATYGKSESKGYAIEAILGHIPPGMTANYVEKVPDQDVAAITDALHARYFDPKVIEKAAAAVAKADADRKTEGEAARLERVEQARKTLKATLAQKKADREALAAAASAADA